MKPNYANACSATVKDRDFFMKMVIYNYYVPNATLCINWVKIMLSLSFGGFFFIFILLVTNTLLLIRMDDANCQSPWKPTLLTYYCEVGSELNLILLEQQ